MGKVTASKAGAAGQWHSLTPVKVVKVVKVSAPNREPGHEVKVERIEHIKQPNGMTAYDILAELPTLVKPVTSLRVVVHPDEAAPGQGWGFGPMKGRPGPKAGAAPEQGNFVLTAISISAGSVPA